ncbi:MAG TPA: hypothetical protein VG297_07665, partial [Bryobacteraceae bacterium]|nr:hypothetical protein [Bryobacteraceae bacterium]
MNRAAWALIAVSAISISLVDRARTQSPTPAPRVQGTLAQLMKGTFYPESNVVFAAQDENPADVKRARDPNMATDLLTSSYGKWDAVENSALAIADVADLMMLPGRKCSNGADVPVGNADWARFVQGLRDAGRMAYEVARTKNQDKMTDVADVMAAACKACH